MKLKVIVGLMKKVNTSLKNILKLIYKNYTGKYLDINEIRKEIKEGNFEILTPDKLFSSWEKQGVFLINSALTTETNIAGAHHSFWEKITEALLTYISLKNENITYFFMGSRCY